MDAWNFERSTWLGLSTCGINCIEEYTRAGELAKYKTGWITVVPL
jgi:hypothetical protein